MSGAPSPVSAIVLAGGDPPSTTIDDRLRAVVDSVGAGLVVAADSGLHAARRLGLSVDLVVGDLDSVDPDALAAACAAGTRVEQHPVDKDATDLELAIHTARDAGATRITVVDAGGGRHDHLLANALVLTSPGFADVEVDAVVGTARCWVVRDRRTITGPIGSLCSLLPAGGAARGVTTTGLRFALAGEDLAPGTTRGVSNEFVAPTATIALDAGVLLVVQPHALEV